jgi:glutathione S-transferase
MILIGQYDSIFVRRVGVAMHLYGMTYEHRPWSAFGDGDRLAAFNPLRRVPTLVLDDGEVLIDSAAILDHLDEVVGPDRALIARSGDRRRRQLKICALGSGVADKAVALIYETVMHEAMSAVWAERCQTQIGAVLDVLNADCPAGYWFGDRVGHADIMVACAMRFLGDAHRDLFDIGRWPALAAHAARCEALPAFEAVSQPFIAPKK